MYQILTLFFLFPSLFLAQFTQTTPVEVSFMNEPLFGDYNAKPLVKESPWGKSIAVWTRFIPNLPISNPKQSLIYASTSNSMSTVWTTPVLIGDGINPNLAMNANGDGVVVWVDTKAINAAFYSSSSQSWTLPIQLSVPTNSAINIVPKVALSKAGKAIAVWVFTDNFTNKVILAADFTAQSNSFNIFPRVISRPIDTYSDFPDIAMDDAGNAEVTWQATIKNQSKTCIFSSVLK